MKNFFFYLTVVVALTSFALPSQALAVDPAKPPCTSFDVGKCLIVPTALGDIETAPGPFISRLAGIMLAASGSIALLLIIRSGYKIMSARGNPEGIQQGREQLVSAIIGLMFIIFSFVFLEVIGTDLFKVFPR